MLHVFCTSEPIYQTPILRQFAAKLTIISSARSIFWLLFVLGVARGVFLWLAYPPAHGADSHVYFLYAARFAGNDFVLATQRGYPLYSLFILVSFYWLGSAYWLLALQLLMAAAIAPLYYQALKRFSPALAVLVSVVILFDVQVAVVFNFTSTEPLYIFLMAVLINVYFHVMDAPLNYAGRLSTIVGVLLALLLLTRSVARFLVVPFAGMFVIRTYQWRNLLLMLVGFSTILGLFSILSLLALGGVEGINAGNDMLANIVNANPQWLSADNGPNSATYISVTAGCNDHIFFCLKEYTGDWIAGGQVISGTAYETLRAYLIPYIGGVWAGVLNFLSLTGQQYWGPELVSDVQCENLDDRIGQIDRDYLMGTTWGWALPDYSRETIDRVRESISPIMRAMCPHLPHVPAFQALTDRVALGYRSLGRPNPHLWYGVLLLLTLIFPWVRQRYINLILTVGGSLLYHALVSAIVFNIQPRYVVVTNPLRATLLVLLFYVGARIVLHELDYLVSKYVQIRTRKLSR